MTTISDPVVIGTSNPTLGMFVGTTSTADVLQRVNALKGRTQFSERFDPVRNAFTTNYIAPLRLAIAQLERTVAVTVDPTKIIVLDSMEALQIVPPSMFMPILLYQPVRDLFEKGRVDGFGFAPQDLPEEDYYGRMLNNGYVEDVASAIKDDGTVTFRWMIHSDDPELDSDERNAIRRTREFIDYVLFETAKDPTDINSVRG